MSLPSRDPIVCPSTLFKMTQGVRKLGEYGARVQGLFVTLDPKRDTAAVFASYVAASYPSSRVLSAEPAAIDAAAGNVRLFLERQRLNAGSGYWINHLGSKYVFDGAGHLRLFFSAGTPTKARLHEVEVLL